MKKKLVLLAASLVFATLLAELVLRIGFGPHVTQIYRLDPEVLHELIPDTTKYFVHHPANGGGKILVEVNSQGYRGADLLPRDPARRRVVVFGDSCVMGEFSELENTFCEQFEARLAQSTGNAVEVVNAGVVAYGPDQTSVKMARELAGLAPDLAVAVIFADNDYGDLMRNKMFRLDDDGQLTRHPFRLGDELQAKFAAGLGTPALYRWAKRFKRNMRARAATDRLTGVTDADLQAAAVYEVERWLEGCRDEYRSYVVAGDPEVRFLIEDHFDSDVCLEPSSVSASYKIRLLDAVLGRMQELCRAQGVPFALLVIPSPWVICSPRHGGHVDRARHPDHDPRAMSGHVEAAADRRGIACLHLFDTFVAAGPDRLYFLAPDNHWNDVGQALAAETFASFVVERGLLPARSR